MTGTYGGPSKPGGSKRPAVPSPTQNSQTPAGPPPNSVYGSPSFSQPSGGQSTTSPIQPQTATPQSGAVHHTQQVMVLRPKSPGLAVFLALVFGGFGLMYVSIPAGFGMAVVTIVASLLFFPLGVLMWIATVVMAYVMATAYNEELLTSARSSTN